MTVRGVVLAGGKSSRFGEDKALVKMNGTTFLEKAVNLLKELETDPVVITNSYRDYSFIDCPIYKDRIADRGPLGGLYTACELFKGEVVFVLTCDMPALKCSNLRTLLEAHQKGSLITVYVNQEGEVEPFPGLYDSGLSDLILARVEHRPFAVRAFIDAIPQRAVIPFKEDARALLSVNQKSDLEALPGAISSSF